LSETFFVFFSHDFFFSFSSSPHQTSNSVYEIVSDMSARQDALEERLSSLEDKLQGLQVSTWELFLRICSWKKNFNIEVDIWS
jgi:hypothetical protein